MIMFFMILNFRTFTFDSVNRILAADHMPLEVLDKPKVCVCFILEDHLNQCLDENRNIIPETLKAKSQELKNDSVDFSKIKKTQKYEGKFTNIQLKFDRGTRQKFVHEEKYRLVFYMEMHGSFIWVSLNSFTICILMDSSFWLETIK